MLDLLERTVPAAAAPADTDGLVQKALTLPSSEIALALALSDLPTFDQATLTQLEDHPNLWEPEHPPAPNAELAATLAAWIAQGMERIGGERELWRHELALRHLEKQGMDTWAEAPMWGGEQRALTAHMLAWNFHAWAGFFGDEPGRELVTLWTYDPDFPEDGEIGVPSFLRDLEFQAEMRPRTKLVAVSGGYRFALDMGTA